jgi:GT2 family glycosyltransferase
MSRITIGVTTKNRPELLRGCLASLAVAADLIAEIIVVDDTSETPIDEPLRAVPPALSARLRVIRLPDHEGYIVGRNRIMREATSDYVLLLDDDAQLLDAGSIRAGLGVMEADDRVAAVAFAMANADGSPWHAQMQASPAAYACYVPSFIGFAHLLRRRVFLDLNGYRESFVFYGEEKDYCRRLLSSGFSVVYLPAARIAHLPLPAGRSATRYLRYVSRNDCLCTLYNDPFTLLPVTLPMRLIAYFRMRRGWKIDDPGGFWWLLREVIAVIPSVVRDRTPMRFADLRRWRELRRLSPRYVPRSA